MDEKQASLRTDQLIEYDREHVLHGMGRIQETHDCVIESAEGIIVRDTEGKEYIDLGSQAVNVNLGHGRREIIEAAQAQMEKLVFASTLRGNLNLPSILLAQKLTTIVPKGLDHFVWTHTGAETVDFAFRFAHSYWRAKGAQKYKIISLYNSYHGTLLGVAAATSSGNGIFQPLSSMGGHFSHVHIPNYNCYRCPFKREYPGCDIACAHFLEYTIVNEGRDNVAAFIAEPVQGGGGNISPPPEYWPIVREICRKCDVLLMADEVMTGFARTGNMFAVEHWGIVPDMMILSKGIVAGYLPFAALAVSSAIHDTLKGEFCAFGSTQSGNPLCAAVACKCIDIYLKENVPQHVADVGQRAMHRFTQEFLPLPHVGSVSGLGLMLSLEIVTDKATKGIPGPEGLKQLFRRGLQRGLYLRILGNRLCYSPPLTISQNESDHAINIMLSLLSDLTRQDLA